MMGSRNPNTARPEMALEAYGSRLGEYPIRLLTRRDFSLRAEEVIDRRETAPNPVWLTRPPHPGAWGQSSGG